MIKGTALAELILEHVRKYGDFTVTLTVLCNEPPKEVDLIADETGVVIYEFGFTGEEIPIEPDKVVTEVRMSKGASNET